MEKTVYLPKPELTLFKDTFFKCEVIKAENNRECKLRVRSVHVRSGGLLEELTARHEDSIIIAKKNHLFESEEMMKDHWQN